MKKTTRELFVAEFAEQIRDKRHEDQADAIVRCIELMGGKIPDPKKEKEEKDPPK